MKIQIREVEGDGFKLARKRILSFKEFCHYVYEPTQKIKALNLPEEKRLELEQNVFNRLELFH
jgi:hypothetical protein